MRAVASAAGPVDAGPTVLTMRRVFDDLFALRRTDSRRPCHAPPRSRCSPATGGPTATTLDLHADPEASAGRDPRPRRRPARRIRLPPLRRPRRPPLRGLRRAGDAGRPTPAFAGRRGRMSLRTPRSSPAWPRSHARRSRSPAQFRDPRLRQLFGRYATYVGGSPLRLARRARADLARRGRGRLARRGRDAPPRRRAGGAGHRLGVHASASTPGPTGSNSGRAGRRRPARRRPPPPRRPRRVQRRSRARWPPASSATAPSRSVADGRHRTPQPLRLRLDLRRHAARRRPPPPQRVLRPPTRARVRRPRPGRLPDDPTLYICAQDRGTGRQPSGDERFEIILNARPRPPTRPPREEITRCRTRTFAHPRPHGPELLAGSLRVATLTTPLDFDGDVPRARRARSTGGARTE